VILVIPRHLLDQHPAAGIFEHDEMPDEVRSDLQGLNGTQTKPLDPCFFFNELKKNEESKDIPVVIVSGASRVTGVDIKNIIYDKTFSERKEKALGEHTSTRNSGVIHGGIYYPSGSLKARLCIRGRHLTYEFLRKHNIPHRKCGKVIVALVNAERKALEDLKRRGEENGVENLRLLDEADVKEIEYRRDRIYHIVFDVREV
jgi:hypothetical protein